MGVALLLLVVGLVLLVLGADLLVRGASGIALLARIAPAVVGLTVVAAGTSMPELVVSLRAAVSGNVGLAAGNIVGSNIFNIAAIIGVTALLRPLRVQGNSVRLEWPVMLLSAFVFHLLVRDGSLDRLEGAFLTVGMLVFTAYIVYLAKRTTTAAEQAEFEGLSTAAMGKTGNAALLRNVLAVIVGIAVLAGGAEALVAGATRIARSVGISETIIGLTVVAAGTSLPELATSLLAAFKGRDDIAIANVIGSNIFNVLGIGGVTALILPLSVPAEIVARDNWWMLGVSALLFPLMRTGMRVNRAAGLVLSGCFAAYWTILFLAVR
jgi:cation:H+ antiporter